MRRLLLMFLVIVFSGAGLAVEPVAAMPTRVLTSEPSTTCQQAKDAAATAAAKAQQARQVLATSQRRLSKAKQTQSALTKKLRKAKRSGNAATVRRLTRKLAKASGATRRAKRVIATATTRSRRAGAASAAASAAVPAACAVRSGTLTVTIRTPDGVPAAVALSPAVGPGDAAVGKPAEGTTQAQTLSLTEGAWSLAPQPVLSDGRLYEADPASVTVVADQARTIDVTYAAVPGASDLQVDGFTSDTITLGWTQPDGAVVAVRHSEGKVPPATVEQGEPVAIDGDQATATGLFPGDKYSFSLFTQVGGTWRGPLTLSATTESGGYVPTYVEAPGAVVVEPGTQVQAVVSDGMVRAMIPGSDLPAPGQAVVLPIGEGLPGGFVGRVSSVGSDGSVLLEQAGLSAAFDYLDFSVPDLDSRATRPAGRFTWRRSAPQRLGVTCEGAGGAGLSFDQLPVPSLGGHFDGGIAIKKFLGVPRQVGAELDVEVTVSVTLSLTVAAEGAVTCEAELPEFVRQFQIGPVPLLLKLAPVAEAEFSARAAVSNIGLTATGGFSSHTYIPLLGVGGGPEIEADLIGYADPLTPEGEMTATASLRLGGEIVVGPGLGTGDAGVVAGISGYVNPIDATISSVAPRETCFNISAGYSAGIGLTARAWVDDLDLDWEKTFELVDGRRDYGGPWQVPFGCDTRPYSGFVGLVGSSTRTVRNSDGSLATSESGSIDVLVQYGPRGGPQQESGTVIHRRTGSWSQSSPNCTSSLQSSVQPGVWTPDLGYIGNDGGVRGEVGPMVHFPVKAPATGTYTVCGNAEHFDGMTPYWNVLPPAAQEFLKKSYSLRLYYAWRDENGDYPMPHVVDDTHTISMEDMCGAYSYSPYTNGCDWSYSQTGTVTGQHRIRMRLTDERDADFDGIPDRSDANPTVVDPL